MTSGGSMRYDVGGVSFTLRCDGARIVADLEPPYRPFIDSGPAPSGDGSSLNGDAQDVDVEVMLGPSCALESTLPLFESGRSWAMRADGNRRVFYHRDPGRDTPLWTVEFPIAVEEVTVWCDAERWAPRAATYGVPTPIRYPLDQILIMYALAQLHGLLVHSTGIVLDGLGLVCCGVSGAGKSTLARQFLSVGARDLLSDDRVILRRLETGWAAFGTPWAGDAGVAVNARSPLGALLFLRQSDRNLITPLGRTEALHRLLPVTSIPWYDAGVMAAALSVCDDLTAATPAFELEFRPEPAAADTVRNLVSSGCLT